MSFLPVRRPRADVLRDLAVLASGRPPFVSVYLDVSPGHARATASRRLQADLDRVGREQDVHSDMPGVIGPLFEHIDTEIRSTQDDEALLVTIANADGKILTATYPDPPRHDVVAVGDVPRLGPLLTVEQGLTHHVVAVIRGTDVALMTVPRHGEATQTTYAGNDALAIAPVVQHACRTSGTKLLIVCAPADELPSVEQQIRTGLPISVDMAAVVLDDLDSAELATEIVVRTAAHASTKTVELLRLYRFHQSHGETADGAAAACAALTNGRTALVLVNEDERDDRQGWIVFEKPGTPPLVGVGVPAAVDGWRTGRLADVVISAAVISGCGVHVVPSVEETLGDGVGAILADRADPSGLADLLER